MKTYWLNGETISETLAKQDQSEVAGTNHVTIDEGIDDIDEITFTFHVSDHDSDSKSNNGAAIVNNTE